jgi:hypothetical protein
MDGEGKIMAKNSTFQSENLKDRYILWLLDNANACYENWQRAHDNGKRKMSRKWLGAWQAWMDELELVGDQPAGVVSKYIFNSVDFNSIVSAFAFEAWGWMQTRIILDPILD